MKQFIFFLIISCLYSCTDPIYVIEKEDNPYLNTELTKSLMLPTGTTYSNSNDSVSSYEEAVLVAESVLFDTYGESQIKSQRPYTIAKIKNYYVMTGMMYKHQDGGTFLFILNADDGSILNVTHYK